MDIDGFTDDFDRGELTTAMWLPHHLPQWSDREASRARYRFTDRSVVLFIADDQQPWCPEFDGDVRVSALQSGCFAGPLGSPIGQHRFNEHVVVREEQTTRRLGLCHRGSIEVRCRAHLTPTALASLYLIGFEESPNESGEVTVMEVFGHGATEGSTRLGRGIKAINDPHLVDEFTDEPVAIDVADWHTYRIDWRHDGIVFSCDDERILTTAQAPDYRMQIMLTLYELPAADGTITTPTSATFEIDQITYRPLGQPECTP